MKRRLFKICANKNYNMKNVFAMLLSVFCMQTIYAQDTQNSERITDESVPFVYESRAKLPTSDEKLAEYLYPEYRNAPDEFTKQELFEKIKPVLKSNLTEAKAKDEYYLRVSTELGQYDFNNKTFPSGFSSSTYIPYPHGYGVMFDNLKDVISIPVPLDAAKSLSGKLQRSRVITAVVYCKVIRAEEEKMQYRDDVKAVKAHITKVDFSFSDGTLISTINTP